MRGNLIDMTNNALNKQYSGLIMNCLGIPVSADCQPHRVFVINEKKMI